MTFFQKIRNKIVPNSEVAATAQVTNESILEELVACFVESCKNESVGNSLLFDMHFIIVLHPQVYEDRLAAMPTIVKEAVDVFYEKLNDQNFLKNKNKIRKPSPVASTWLFKFSPGTEFDNKIISQNNINVIGMLTGIKETPIKDDAKSSSKTTVTIRSKTTNVFDRMDINLDLLKQINFLDNGIFSIRYNPVLKQENNDIPSSQNIDKSFKRDPDPKTSGFAKIGIYVVDDGKEETYTMQNREIVIARKEPSNQNYTNYLLVESKYVSNPHARIRLDEASGKFQIASFSRFDTRVNNNAPLVKSEPTNPVWSDLENDCKILLNGMVTLYFKSTYKI